MGQDHRNAKRRQSFEGRPSSEELPFYRIPETDAEIYEQVSGQRSTDNFRGKHRAELGLDRISEDGSGGGYRGHGKGNGFIQALLAEDRKKGEGVFQDRLE